MKAQAKLIKRKTDDGMMEIQNDVPLGRIYKFDLKTKRMQKGMHLDTKTIWEREMVLVEGSWFPTELLEIEENNVNEGKQIS